MDSLLNPVSAHGVHSAKGGAFPVGENPTRLSLQPKATGIAIEAMKWLKPSVKRATKYDGALAGPYLPNSLRNQFSREPLKNNFFKKKIRNQSQFFKNYRSSFPLFFIFSPVIRRFGKLQADCP